MILITQNKASKIPYAPTKVYLGKLSKKNTKPTYFVFDGGKWKININDSEWISLLERRATTHPESVLKMTPGVKKAINEIEKNMSDDIEEEKKKEKKTPEKKKRGRPKKVKQEKGNKKNNESEKSDEKEPEQQQKTKSKKQQATEDLIEGMAAQLNKDLSGLIHESNIATLEEQILKNEKIRYENQIKKVELQKQSGELIEMSLAQFLFFGYMEKLNIELLGLCKKIQPMIDNLVKEKNTKGVLKRFNREFGNILTSIRKAQADDLEEWEGEK